MLEALRRDAAYAARALAGSPLFTLVALLSVAIGVGATTGIVTIANAALFKMAPGIAEPERVVQIGRSQNGSGFDNMSYPNYFDMKAAARSYVSMALVRFDPQPVSVAGPSGGEAANALVVGGTFFDVLKARPSMGRFFVAAEDEAPGANPAVVLSHKYWRAHLAGDSGIVGRSLTLNARPFSVVGVAAEGFNGPLLVSPDMWVTTMGSTLLGFEADVLEERGAVWHWAIARLAPDATLESAQAELNTIGARLANEYKQQNERRGFAVMPTSLFPGTIRQLVAGFLAILLALAGLVLVVASTNVAGMLLARATIRQREIAVRLALGASRGRLVSQLVTESLLLFLAAGAAGIVLAIWMVNGLVALVPRLPFPVAIDAAIDWRVLLVALAVSLVTGLATGVVPALQATNPALVPALKSDGGGSGRRHRLRSALLVAQIAFSMLLLIVGGLFSRALVRANAIDPGFDPRGLEIAALDLKLANYNDTVGTRFAAMLLDRVRQVPRVEAAALVRVLPLGGSKMGMGGVRVDGVEPPAGGWDPHWNVVSPDYFETMRIPLQRGRDFTAADRRGAPRVAILNEAFAEQLWPGRDPVGQSFRNGDNTVTVIGIARDAKYRSLGEPRSFMVYVPIAQNYMSETYLLTRTATGAAPVQEIRRLVAALDRNLPILSQQSFESHAATSLFPQRVAVYVAGSLGGVALLLALIGIYGVTAFSVAQRTREIGVRMALGADRARVVSMVLRQGLGLASIGVVIGAAAGFGVTRVLNSLLYGVDAMDSIAFLGAAGLLSVAAVVACWIPARRAAAVDPVVALRAD